MLRPLFFLALLVLASGAHIHKRAPRNSGRIVEGKNATIEQFPHQVSLLKFGYPFCGGSILTEKFILTAGHCSEDLSPSKLAVRAGSSIYAWGGSVHNVVAINIHADYDPFNLDYDVSVVELATSLTFSLSVQPISLATSRPTIGTTLVVTGWGITVSGGNAPIVLQEVDVPLISHEQCVEQYEDRGQEVTNTMFCAGHDIGGKDSCQGDSGGAAVVSNAGKLEQIGVVSWGLSCADPRWPGVYADLSHLGVRAHIKAVADV